MPKNKIETQLSKENTNRKQVKTLTEGMEEFLKYCKVRNLSPYTLRYCKGLFHEIKSKADVRGLRKAKRLSQSHPFYRPLRNILFYVNQRR